MIETAFNVAIEYPLGRSLFSQYLEALFYRIGCGPSRPEAIRVRVCQRFRHWVKSKQVKSLHTPAFHDGNTQRTLFAVFLWVELSWVVTYPTRLQNRT